MSTVQASGAPGLPDTGAADKIFTDSKAKTYDSGTVNTIIKHADSYTNLPMCNDSLLNTLVKLGMAVCRGSVASSGNNKSKEISGITGCVVKDALNSNLFGSTLSNIGKAAQDLRKSVESIASNYIDITTSEGKQVVDSAYQQVASNQNVATSYDNYNHSISRIVDQLQSISFISFDGNSDFSLENEKSRNVTKTPAQIRQNYSRVVMTVSEKAIKDDPDKVVTKSFVDYQVASTSSAMSDIANKYQLALNELISDLQKLIAKSSSSASSAVSSINNAKAKVVIASNEYNERYKPAFSQSKMDASDLPADWRPENNGSN